MGFVPSLHPLSVLEGIHASALRTPARAAVVQVDGHKVKYSELMHNARPCVVGDWLASMACAGPDEHRPAAVYPGGVLSHRELLLRAFDRIVQHAAFDRDGHMALTLPLASEAAYVAATISLWLGGTLHLLDAGDTAGLVEGIATGRFDTCWIGASGLEGFERRREALPAPAGRFVLAVCEGSSDAARRPLARWLGETRVTS